MPAIIAASWDELQKTNDLAILTQFHVRFIGSFTTEEIFFTYIGLSLSFITTGALCLVYLLYENIVLIYVAILIQLASTIIAAISIIYIYSTARYVKTEEIQKLLDYALAKPIKKHLQQQKNKSSSEKRQNSLR